MVKEYLDEAISKGRVALATAHMGNWELHGMVLGRSRYPLCVIAREAYDTRLNDILWVRQPGRCATILRDSPRAGREILQALRQKGRSFHADSPGYKVKGVMVRFFWEKGKSPAGAAIIARKRSVL